MSELNTLVLTLSDFNVDDKVDVDDFSNILIPLNVTKIIASGCNLKSLYGLPNHILDLDVSNNRLENLEHCPLSVKNLRASKNKIKSLEAISNHSIKALGISYNHLTSFEGCPSSVESIVGVSNFITSLKGLPSKMRKLYVSYNQLKSMNGCPIVDILDCSCNLLESFKDIPDGVKELTISNNPFVSNDVTNTVITLSDCPSSVTWLRCSSCNISNLKGFPANLKLIEAFKNDIIDLAGIDDVVPEVFIDRLCECSI